MAILVIKESLCYDEKHIAISQVMKALLVYLPLPNKQWLFTILKFACSAAVLALIFYMVDFHTTWSILLNTQLAYLPVIITLAWITGFFNAYRWKKLVEPFQVTLPYGSFFRMVQLGNFFSLFLPGAIGGDAWRVFALAKQAAIRKRKALFSTFLDRGMGLFALMLGVSVLSFTQAATAVPVALRGFLMLITLGLILVYLLIYCLPGSFFQRFGERAQALVQMHDYFQTPSTLIPPFCLSIIVHVLIVLAHCLIAFVLKINVGFVFLFLLYGLACLASVLPLTFNGIGLREGAYVTLFSAAHVPSEKGLAFAVYWFFVITMVSLLGGIPLLFHREPLPLPTDSDDE